MSVHRPLDCLVGLRAIPLLFLGLLLGLPTEATGQLKNKLKRRGPKDPAAVGRPVLPSAMLHRGGPDNAWRIVKPTELVHDGDLLVALPQGAIDSKNGAVRLTLMADLARLSPYPVLESAVTLHADRDRDLNFTLERGRVDLTNRKKASAQVRVEFQKHHWDITLGQKARVALELYGRWPRGVPFSRNPKAGDEPALDLVLLVIMGDVELKAGGNEYALHAPPGPAYYHWDSIGGKDEAPQRLDDLPAWARPGLAALPQVKDVTALLKVLRERILGGASVEESIAELLESKNPRARRMAVFALAALDDLPPVLDALGNSSHQEVRDAAVVALRHWIGRGAGQDQRLYDVLVKEGKFTENQAAILMQLLHSFGDSDLARPATYETLIDYLMSKKAAIREIAAWHLYRLVPAGKDIAYSPAAPEEDRRQAYEKWKKLVPAGQLPPEAPKGK